MGKLNELIVVEKGIKGTANSAITEAYKTAQKTDLFNISSVVEFVFGQ